MSHYRPPKSALEVSQPARPLPAVKTWSLLIGAASYYVYHYLAGVLGQWSWPPTLNWAARLYRPVTVPVADLLVLGAPMVLAYGCVFYAWPRAARNTSSLALLACCVGWLIPALFVIGYGESKQPGALVTLWSDWPHVLALHLSPLAGICLGFRYARKRAQSRASAA